MKTCSSCGEDFEDKFSCCPVDATPLKVRHILDYRRAPSTAHHRPTKVCRTLNEYHPTLLNNRGLLERLVVEIEFTVFRVKTAWPDFKRDPVGFGKATLSASTTLLKQQLSGSTLASRMVAVSVVLTAVLAVALVDRIDFQSGDERETNPAQELAQILTIPATQQIPDPSDTGVGVGSKGRVGLEVGKGEGSRPETKRARGGGGGGDNDPTDPQQGKVPQYSEIPAPIPQSPPKRNPVLPVAGVDIDPALWKDLAYSKYGDPRSTSTAPSNGSGEGGGMGTNRGQGIGEGSGDGFGPGSDGNMGDERREIGGSKRGGGSGTNPALDPNYVFPTSTVSQRPRVLSKPEPQYTEEARKNLVTGTVVLRVVFSRSGEVTNIRTVAALPFGLTERAIMAARQIRFSPATRDGHAVSVYMQLEYNFNLY